MGQQIVLSQNDFCKLFEVEKTSVKIFSLIECNTKVKTNKE